MSSPLFTDVELYNNAETERLKTEICEIGRRMWAREYCDGNGGNISVRLSPNRFLVTPTGVSKGFMTPGMLCLVDENGRQVIDGLPPSSEFITHLALYEASPSAISVCHAHPCHAGAFAIKNLKPPGGLLPEIEVFVGELAIAPYRTPGTTESASAVRPLAASHQSIILGNHGVICWGKSVEDAYFKMEITDAYCRTILLANMLPSNASIPDSKLAELLSRRANLNLPLPRPGDLPATLA